MVAAVLLLSTNGFFVAAEFSLVKARSFRIEALAKEGSASARLTMHIRSRLEALQARCQLGITMASPSLGWVGEPAVAALLEPLFHALFSPLAHRGPGGFAFDQVPRQVGRRHSGRGQSRQGFRRIREQAAVGHGVCQAPVNHQIAVTEVSSTCRSGRLDTIVSRMVATCCRFASPTLTSWRALRRPQIRVTQQAFALGRQASIALLAMEQTRPQGRLR